MKKNTAWLLAVVSDVGQAEGIPHQQRWAMETAEREGWSITREFSKAGSSGRDGVRQLVTEMIDTLTATPRDQRPERILMIRQDRLGRGDSLDTIAVLATLRKLGVTIHTREAGDTVINRAIDAAMPMLRSLTAALENDVRVDKATAVYDRRRRAKEADPTRAVANYPSYGLTFRGGFIIPLEPAASVVRQAFQLRADGLGCYTISKQLRDLAPPMALKNGGERKIKFDPDFVARMLKKRAYLEAGLIDALTWDKAQGNDKKMPTKPRKYDWPLTGALRCECGFSLSGMSSQPRQTRYFWYVCRDRQRLHEGLKAYPKADIEEQFIALLKLLRSVPSIAELTQSRTADDGDRRKLLMKKLTQLKVELTQIPRSIERAWAAFDAGEIPGDMVKARVSVLEAKQRETQGVVAGLDEELRALNARQSEAEQVRSTVEAADELWPKALVADQKALAKKVAAALGGALIVSLDGTLEKDLVGKIALARIAGRARSRSVKK